MFVGTFVKYWPIYKIRKSNGNLRPGLVVYSYVICELTAMTDISFGPYARNRVQNSVFYVYY